MAIGCEHGAACHDGTEPSAASAPEASRAWLLVEHPGPWPAEAAEAELLALIRRALTAALDRHDDVPTAHLLRARVLAADRLPGQAMVTAGTLLDKSRTGARDINKFYGTTGPNYLR